MAIFPAPRAGRDRKSTRLNSSHPSISYAVFCLKKKSECEVFRDHQLVLPLRRQCCLSWLIPTRPPPPTAVVFLRSFFFFLLSREPPESSLFPSTPLSV